MTRLLGRSTRALVVAAAALALTVPTAATASEQPSAERASAASGLTVRFQSWGPLELGMNHRQSLRTGMVTRKLGRCEPGYQMKKRFLERGFAVWRGTFPRMHVRMIVVTGSVDRTASGAGEGTTLRGLRDMYGDRLRVRRGSVLEGQPSKGDDLWVATVRKPHGALNFHFAYGPRPRAGSKVEYTVVARKATVYWGC